MKSWKKKLPDENIKITIGGIKKDGTEIVYNHFISKNKTKINKNHHNIDLEIELSSWESDNDYLLHKLKP